MVCDFPKDFYLPDGKNSKMSQIINKWVFDRQTPDGNEGVGIKIPYLKHALGTMSLAQLMVILMQSTIIKLDQQISLAISVHLISGS